MAHQQSDERRESRSALAGWYTFRQRSAGGDGAARTVAAVKLIFGNDRFDGRQLPNLVPEWFGIGGLQFASALPASIDRALNNRRAIFRRYQLS